MNLIDIMLSEGNKTQKIMYCLISFILYNLSSSGLL